MARQTSRDEAQYSSISMQHSCLKETSVLQQEDAKRWLGAPLKAFSRCAGRAWFTEEGNGVNQRRPFLQHLGRHGGTKNPFTYDTYKDTCMHFSVYTYIHYISLLANTVSGA